YQWLAQQCQRRCPPRADRSPTSGRGLSKTRDTAAAGSGRTGRAIQEFSQGSRFLEFQWNVGLRGGGRFAAFALSFLGTQTGSRRAQRSCTPLFWGSEHVN